MEVSVNVRMPRLPARILVAAILVSAAGLVALNAHQGPRPVQAQSVDRAAVSLQFLDARSKGHLEGALAAFTDDAVFTATVRSGACGAATPCFGAAALRSTFQRQI